MVANDRARARKASDRRPRGSTGVPESKGTEVIQPEAIRVDRPRLKAGSFMAGVIAQRKFTLALMFAVAGITGLFIDKLTGDQFNFLVGIILSIFGAANVIEKRESK